MATKQYEYFGNQQPIQTLRNNQAKLNAQRAANVKANEANWQQDPWYTLGSAIGQAWGDNYNSRGINKAQGEMQEALSRYLTPQQQTPQMIAEQQGPLSNVANGSIKDSYVPNDNGNFIQEVAPSFTQTYLSKYGPGRENIVGDTIAQKDDLDTLQKVGDNISFDGIDRESAKDYVRRYLTDVKKRRPDQVEAVMANFDNIYNSKEKQWGTKNATSWLQQGADALKKKDFATANQLYAKAGKWLPEEAKAGLQESIYQRNLADKIAAEQRQIQNSRDQYLWQLELQKKLGIGAFKPTVGRASSQKATSPKSSQQLPPNVVGGKQGVSFQEYNAFIKIPKDERSQYQNAAIEEYENNPNHGMQTGIDLNDPNQVANYVSGIYQSINRNGGMNYNQGMKMLSRVMASPYAEAVLSRYVDGKGNPYFDYSTIRDMKEKEKDLEYMENQ